MNLVDVIGMGHADTECESFCAVPQIPSRISHKGFLAAVVVELKRQRLYASEPNHVVWNKGASYMGLLELGNGERTTVIAWQNHQQLRSVISLHIGVGFRGPESLLFSAHVRLVRRQADGLIELLPAILSDGFKSLRRHSKDQGAFMRKSDKITMSDAMADRGFRELIQTRIAAAGRMPTVIDRFYGDDDRTLSRFLESASLAYVSPTRANKLRSLMAQSPKMVKWCRQLASEVESRRGKSAP